MQDHYAALGIASDATLNEIRTAFRQKASIYHPDKNPSKDAAALFRMVQKAYETLSDQESREAYDDNRRRSLLENPIETATVLWTNYLEEVLK